MNILPLRLLLDSHEPLDATVPMLRGRWGEVLKALDEAVYDEVFHPQGGAVPLYVVRPAPADPQFAPALECLLLGSAVRHVEIVLRAWDVAGGRGIGDPSVWFVVRRRCGVSPEGALLESPTAWAIDDARWPLWGDPQSTPCRLSFPVPLRLVRKNWERGHDEMVRDPNLTHLVDAAIRRFQMLGVEVSRDERQALLSVAEELPQQSLGWEERDLAVVSPGLRRKPDRRGVVGELALPQGAGPLWRLLAQMQWLHFGKSTVHGLGQLIIEGL
ncbi:MAG: CRISPR system precrRNA processing endoribonuclease RAMP protein Cas6 [Planctomycetaceae bacterium]